MIRYEGQSKHAEEFQKEGNYLEPDFILITITDAKTLYDETGKPYTSYLLSTETTFPQYSVRTFSLRRRYSDFVLLRKILVDKCEAQDTSKKHGPIPPLPGDSVTSLFGQGRFEPAFIEDRRKGLEQFINGTANHTFARFDSELHKFLQDPKAEFSTKKASWW